jgi:hypothetical protein
MNAEQKEFFEKGKQAQLAGVTKNPYSPNSRAGEAWSMGWYEAFEAQLGDEDINIHNLSIDEEPLSIHDLKQEIADENLEEDEEWND